MTQAELKCLEFYLSHIGGLDDSFGNCSRIYSMTTENIWGYLKSFNLENKKVLTVAGSGDQRLNCLLAGAEDVVCFDINPITNLLIKLKDAAVVSLNFEEFINFFNIYTRKYGKHYSFMDKKLFEKIAPILDEDALDFFSFIVNEATNLDLRKVFWKTDNKFEVLSQVNNYLNPDSYEELKDILKNKKVNFINSSINSLPDRLNDDNYDFILLSNISDYIHKCYGKDGFNDFKETIDSLNEKLNNDGIIQVGYIYSQYRNDSSLYSKFRIDEERNKVFRPDLFYSISVDSYSDSDKKDKVIVYHK